MAEECFERQSKVRKSWRENLIWFLERRQTLRARVFVRKELRLRSWALTNSVLEGTKGQNTIS